ncbi:MAG: tetratricopeptide repeat protein [Planctomycetaceae bacterium]
MIWILALAALPAHGAEGAWGSFNQGLKAYEKGDFVGAEAAMRAALAQDTRVEDAHYYLGLCLERKGDEGARASFLKVTEAYPTYSLAQERLGQLCLKAKDLEGACRHFEIAVKARPSADGWLRLGVVETERKRYVEAEAALKQGEELSKGNLELQDALARVYLETDRFADALARYDAILKVMPSDTGPRLGRAACLKRLERTGEAADELQAILKLDPLHTGALAMLVELWSGEPGRAQECDQLKKRLAWVKKNPPKVTTAPPPAR